MSDAPRTPLSRRHFLRTTLAAGAGSILPAGPLLALPGGGAPAVIPSSRLRPELPSGVQSGDVTSSRALVWSRSDRPARLWVEWSTREDFRDARRAAGTAALEETGFTASLDLSGLPAGQQIFYRVRFDSLEFPGTWSEPLTGHFRTPQDPLDPNPRPVRLAWSGDCVGQGWGIDESRGGMRIFEAMRQADPDVFIHSGDIIYADQPLEPEVLLDDGTLWRNLVTPAKAKVAETLDEFRGNFAYNLLDPQTRAFHASVPVMAQWDDHEVVNNWFPGLQLDYDDRYRVKSASLLAERARRALFEFTPIRRSPEHPDRIHRHYRHGPLLEVFLLDLRSHRGRNTPNRQPEAGEDTDLLGAEQMQWLQTALRESRAAWKVIASDMPLGLLVPDRPREGERTWEAFANGENGAPLGRELEVARLLAALKRERIRNVVWVTADVHYAAAHHYSPDRAAFTDFDPFWEFVAGPMHAGTFGPNALDSTFGPEVVFQAVAPAPNRPPSDDLQFFGLLDIDPRTRALTAAIHDRQGRRLWSRELPHDEG
jgi:alkaline phosphatase D